MAGYSYRMPRRYRHRPRGNAGPVLVVAAAALLAASGTKSVSAIHHGAAPGVVLAAARGGTLSCSGLEALWTSAGGSPGTAFTAAEVARAESGGRQYATDDDGNGTADRGYWQVNSIHGALSTYDPAGNARAAVLLSSDGTDWAPWVTYSTAAYRGQC